MLINDIYFNGNIQINDDLLLSLIKSKPKYLQNKGFIKNDIDTVRTLYVRRLCKFFNTSSYREI